MAARKSKNSDTTIYIGIDLGTSRSAISASNGRQEWVQSYVGWPKDFVARKLLGKPVLFGEEALQNRLSVNLIRPLEFGVIRDGTIRNEEAVRELIHHLIEMAVPDEGPRINAAVGVPAEALKVNKLAIRDAVSEYADALMVVSEPFSIAYGTGALANAMVIDIGAGTVDFCVMHGTMPGEEDQRTLTTAGDYIDRRLYDLLVEAHPTAKFSETAVRGYKEEFGFVGQPGNRILVETPVNGKIAEVDITDQMKQACGSVLPPIIETAVDLIGRYEPEFQQQVRKNIHLAGGGSQIRGMADAIETALKEYGPCKVTAVKNPLYMGADGALALAQDMPEEYWEDM